VLLSIRNIGGESTAAWRQFLDDLDARGLKRLEFDIVGVAPRGRLEAALVSLWGERPADSALHRFISTATCWPMLRSTCTTS